ncbi:MAG: hypothetical protein IPK19_05820 [Chloroflexi bacterium]|nr:hypothetical protein [Chloroflexota bacterium]
MISLLNQALTGGSRLILLAAPAGSGKSMLLSAWAAQVGMPVAWFTVDSRDNDFVRFWDYTIAALQMAHPGVGELSQAMLHEPLPMGHEAILTPLINDLAALATPIVLVLDDYHLVETATIHESLAFLLNHLPPNVHLVIASRFDPPLPLHRLRARGYFLELRASDLRFSPEEAAQFLARVMHLSLDSAQVAALTQRTEGWIAGLQLAGLAAQRQPDVEQFVAQFAGDNRYILDYLGDEVLNMQPPPVQEFLLLTSILDRLNGSLCEAVTDDQRASATLRTLEEDNFFIVPLDEQRQWYRYHQLFVEFLRHRLEQTAGVHVPELHRRAAAWYESRGLLTEAIGHALDGGSTDLAVRLIDSVAEIMIWRRVELNTLQSWLNRLPPAAIDRHPRLHLYFAWVLYLVNQLDVAEQHIESAEAATSDDPGVRGVIAAIRSALTGIRQIFPPTIDYARQALELLPDDAIAWRCVASINLGVACAAVGQYGEATRALYDSMDMSQEIGSAFAMLSAFWHMSALLLAQLQLREAEAFCRQLLRWNERTDLQRFPVGGYIAGLMGELALERNDLRAAEAHLTESIEQISAEGFPMALLRVHVAVARVRAAQGIAPAKLKLSTAPSSLWRRRSCAAVPTRLPCIASWVGFAAASSNSPGAGRRTTSFSPKTRFATTARATCSPWRVCCWPPPVTAPTGLPSIGEPNCSTD